MSTPLTPGCSINISPLPNITPAIADCRFKVPLLPRLHGISIILVIYACCQGVKHFPISLPNCCLWSLWTFSCLHTALTSNFACRLPGIGLPHGLPLLQRPIRHALALFLDFLCDSLCSNVQFRMPAPRDWTSTRLTTALTSNPSCCGALFGLPL